MSDFIQAYTELAKAVEDEIAQRRERPAPPALSDGAGDDGPRCGAGGSAGSRRGLPRRTHRHPPAEPGAVR